MNKGVVRQSSLIQNRQRERRVHLRTTGALLAMIVMCAAASATPEADTTEAELLERIDEANAIINKAAIEDDYETVASFYADDVVVLPNHEPMIVGREAFIENEKAAREAGIEVVAIESAITDVFSAGDLIHEIGKYKVTLKVPGPPYPITDTGKYLVIWEIQSDGSLKIKLEMWNNDEMPEY
jgi:ketosteroid isomerase-like protein